MMFDDWKRPGLALTPYVVVLGSPAQCKSESKMRAKWDPFIHLQAMNQWFKVACDQEIINIGSLAGM